MKNSKFPVGKGVTFRRCWIQVPWNGLTVFLGMAGWVFGSATVGFVFIPSLFKLVGVTSFAKLAGSQQATLLLCIQV